MLIGTVQTNKTLRETLSILKKRGTFLQWTFRIRTFSTWAYRFWTYGFYYFTIILSDTSVIVVLNIWKCLKNIPNGWRKIIYIHIIVSDVDVGIGSERGDVVAAPESFNAWFRSGLERYNVRRHVYRGRYNTRSSRFRRRRRRRRTLSGYRKPQVRRAVKTHVVSVSGLTKFRLRARTLHTRTAPHRAARRHPSTDRFAADNCDGCTRRHSNGPRDNNNVRGAAEKRRARAGRRPENHLSRVWPRSIRATWLLHTYDLLIAI